MKETDRAEFLESHAREKTLQKTFNLQIELEAYCDSDVNILSNGAFRFRDIFISVSTYMKTNYTRIYIFYIYRLGNGY